MNMLQHKVFKATKTAIFAAGSAKLCTACYTHSFQSQSNPPKGLLGFFFCWPHLETMTWCGTIGSQTHNLFFCASWCLQNLCSNLHIQIYTAHTVQLSSFPLGWQLSFLIEVQEGPRYKELNPIQLKANVISGPENEQFFRL